MARTNLNKQNTQAEDFEFVKEGDAIEGYLVEVVPLVGKKPGRMFGKPFNKYVLQTENGLESFLGGTVLDKTLTKTPLGTYVWITYLGFPEGKNYKDYQIDGDTEKTIPVATSQTSAAAVLAAARNG